MPLADGGPDSGERAGLGTALMADHRPRAPMGVATTVPVARLQRGSFQRCTPFFLVGQIS